MLSHRPYQTYAGMDEVDEGPLVNSTIVNQSPATDPRLEKTANSPQSNHNIDDDSHEIHKTYHFHNCGTVYVDVTMENCANSNVRRVTYHRPKITDSELPGDEIIHPESSHAAFNGPLVDSLRTRGTFFVGLFSGVSLVAVAFLAFFVMKLSSCGIQMTSL
ncbi:hypothetical protein BYT27DRAFT_7335954 [Phlegmacium glaucopus]|nr:hypothetical protein BYT27DRAFT_7335954 [Phlegmacium glaucopus]